jgi:hypothetical protein
MTELEESCCFSIQISPADISLALVFSSFREEKCPFVLLSLSLSLFSLGIHVFLCSILKSNFRQSPPLLSPLLFLPALPPKLSFPFFPHPHSASPPPPVSLKCPLSFSFFHFSFLLLLLLFSFTERERERGMGNERRTKRGSSSKKHTANGQGSRQCLLCFALLTPPPSKFDPENLSPLSLSLPLSLSPKVVNTHISFFPKTLPVSLQDSPQVPPLPTLS